MKNLDRAMWAVECMTPRAIQTKKIAQYVIKNQKFTSESVAEATNVICRNVSRTLGNLAHSYGFVFTREMVNGRYVYQLVDCKFDGERKPRNMQKEKEARTRGKPILKPTFDDPLWAIALNMSI